jgi:alkylation response protein AidB-like acyl-CoA dehydrogenase
LGACQLELSFGPEYDTFRNEVKTFLHDQKAAFAKAPGSGNEGKAWQKTLIKHGYTARTIPEAYGGFGAEPDILKSRIIAEEFSHAGMNQGLGGQGISMLVPTLLELGTEQQKQQFIKPTIDGEMVWCQGYSEPGAGSDLASLRTSAVIDGDDWVINGQKIWTSTAHLADWIFCLVRTEPEAKKHHGISFLLFDMKTPGIEIRPLVDMTGAANFNEVFFTNVRVPKGQIVGNRGQGWQVANSVLGHERDMLGNPNAALARLNSLLDLMNTETLAGQKLIDHPVYLDRLMQIQGRVMALRFNDMRILSSRLNPGQDATLARLIVKLQGTELRHDLEGLAIDVMGEIGLAYEDNPYLRNSGSWQNQYMYQLGLIIGGGTSQIQKNIISERGLDMPREPRIAK